MSAHEPYVRVLSGESRELARVDRLLRGARVVEEDDLTLVPLGAERAEHRHHGRDPAAAADEQESLRPRARQHEVAVGLREAEDHARASARLKVPRDDALRMGGDRQLDAIVRVLRGRGRVGTSVAYASDLHGDAHVLACAKAAPCARRTDGESHAAGGQVADVGDLSADRVHRCPRVDQLKVMVDVVRPRECARGSRGEKPPAEVPRGPRELWERLHAPDNPPAPYDYTNLCNTR